MKKAKDADANVKKHPRLSNTQVFRLCVSMTAVLIATAIAAPAAVLGWEARDNARVNAVSCEVAREKSIALLRGAQLLSEENSWDLPDITPPDCDGWAELTLDQILRVHGNCATAPDVILSCVGSLTEDSGTIHLGFAAAADEGGVVCWAATQTADKQRYIWAEHTISRKALAADAAESDRLVILDDTGIVYTDLQASLHPADLPADGKAHTLTLEKELYTVSGSVVNHSFTVYTLREIGRLIKPMKLYSGLFAGIGVLMLLFELLLEKQRRMEREHVGAQLRAIAEQCSRMELSARLRFDSEDVFAPLYTVMNTMLDSMQLQMERTEELANCRRKIEIRQLQGQFNPHFVFNLLANLQYLIQVNPEKASGIVSGLSRLLRYSLKNSCSTVPLGEDVENLNNYMMLQQSRYGNRLAWAAEITPELAGCMIPKLLFQPLVENSILHNIDSTEHLHISLTARREADLAVFVIRDDGRGISPGTLFELQQMLGGGTGDSDQIGLFNVHRTIQLAYGEQYGLEIDSIYNRGTVITIRLPYHGEGGQNV